MTMNHKYHHYFDLNYLDVLFHPFSVNGNMYAFLLFSRHSLSPQYSYSRVAFIVCCFGSIPQFLALSLSPISCLSLLSHLLLFFLVPLPLSFSFLTLGPALLTVGVGENVTSTSGWGAGVECCWSCSQNSADGGIKDRRKTCQATRSG